MLDSVRLQRRQSEIRQTLSELVGKTDASEDEIRQMETLDGEYRNNEVRYRAALTAEDTERREAGDELETRSDREYAELVGRFELRQIAFALDEGRALSGATKEVVEELRNAGGYQGIPVPYAALETRAGETVSGADLPIRRRSVRSSTASSRTALPRNSGSSGSISPMANWLSRLPPVARCLAGRRMNCRMSGRQTPMRRQNAA